MKGSAVIGLALAITFATASPGLAQDPAEDWDLAVDPAQELTLASLDFGDNALALRCKAGVLDLLLTGVPASSGPFRTVHIIAPGVAEEVQVWRTQAGLPVISAAMPDRLARLLRAGGDLEIKLESVDAAARPFRYRLPVPASAMSLDRVLSACGEALADDWDLRPRFPVSGIAWAHQELPEYPNEALFSDVALATVRVACVVLDGGGLSECRVLSEAPEGLGFGRNAVAAARRSRLILPEDGAASIGSVVQYGVRFRAPEN